MLSFLTDNWGSALIGVILIALVVLVVIKIRRDKKKGKSSCGCGCSNCPSAGMCHKNSQ